MVKNSFQGYSEEQAINILRSEGRRLEKIARKVWRQYLDSYSPKAYVRTGKSMKGIVLKRVRKIDANHFGIELTFENDLMYHDSVVGSSKKGHSIMLISDGWHSKKLEAMYRGRRVYRHTYYEGFNYIGKVVKEFNAGKPMGVFLDVNWSGKYYK